LGFLGYDQFFSFFQKKPFLFSVKSNNRKVIKSHLLTYLTYYKTIFYVFSPISSKFSVKIKNFFQKKTKKLKN